MDKEQLIMEKSLLDFNYKKLFEGEEKWGAYSVWRDGKNEAVLKSIIASAKISEYAKFLAAEVLRYFHVEPDIKDYPVLSFAYANALARTSAEKDPHCVLTGNLWGLLYENNDVGHLGKQFIKMGKAAVPALKSLLDDNHGKILYEGSEEATLGSAYQYRIKDVAAFYISKILNVTVPFHKEVLKRDEEIERLKNVLENFQ